MNEKIQYRTRPPSAVLKISSSLLVNESRLYLLFVFICGLSLGCCPLLRCLILVVSVYRVLDKI